MPYTPFHMGPALALKLLARRRFSVMVYGVAQVAIDVEPLLHRLRGDAYHHGPAHTYAAATLIALTVAFLAPPLCDALLRLWGRALTFLKLGWLEEEGAAPVTRGVALTSALIGTWTHILLDSFIHSDMNPLAPWTDVNGMLRLLSWDELHLLCKATWALGVIGWVALCVMKRSRRAPSEEAGPTS